MSNEILKPIETQRKSQGFELIKNAAHCLFNTTAGNIFGWIISIWIARQLGPNNYGIFTLVLWFSSIFSWAVGMGFSHAVTKFIAEHQGKQQPELIGPIVMFIMKIEIVLTISVTTILLFFSTAIADYFFSPAESFFFFLAFIGILPGIITAIFSATIEGLQKFEYFTYSNIIITPFSLAAKIYVIVTDKGIAGLLVVMAIFSVVNSIFYLIIMNREKIGLFSRRIPLDADLVKRIHKYNFSVMAINVCDKIIWDKSENFFIGRWCTATEIAFYNLGFNIVRQFSSILPTTFWKVLFPAMSHYAGSGKHHKTQRVFFLTTRYLAFMTFPIGIGGAVLAYPILHYLYGHEFVGAQRPLQLMFLASIITMICNPGAAVLYGYEKQSFIYKLGFIMAAVNIILDILLIKPYGAFGAAICYSFTTIVGSVIGTIYTCRTMHLRFPFASIFKIFFASIIMGVVMELIVLQNYELLGFIIALAAGTIVYLVSSLALGTFEEEDYTLLQTIARVAPPRPRSFINGFINLMSDFKSSQSSRRT